MTTTTKNKKTPRPKTKAHANAERKALVDSLYGSMSWMKLTVDEYLREKHAETDAENENGTVITSDKRFSEASAIVKVRQIR